MYAAFRVKDLAGYLSFACARMFLDGDVSSFAVLSSKKLSSSLMCVACQAFLIFAGALPIQNSDRSHAHGLMVDEVISKRNTKNVGYPG